MLITGASTGIGRASALRLARAGWTVLAGVRDTAAGESLVAELDAAAGGTTAGGGVAGAITAETKTGTSHVRTAGSVVAITLDVTDAEQIAAAGERVRELTGTGAGHGGQSSHGLDALVNNAGIGVGGPLEVVAIEDLRKQIEVNVIGQVAVTQAMLPALRRARGRIVFVSSVGGRVALPFSAPYGASKHAVEAIGDALRGELRSSNVRVSLVEPGSVKTPIWGKSRASAGQIDIPVELSAQYGRVPAAFEKTLHETERRGIPPEQVAKTIERALTAARPRARYLVGRDAWGMVLAHAVLPTRAFDRVVMRALGL